MLAKEIKKRLDSLIQEASEIDPSLAKRLDEIARWVRDLKPGLLTSKLFVGLFLKQIIQDSQIWLDIKSVTSDEELQIYYECLSTSEKYWYSYLFPKWLIKNDPKFYIWRQKLMAGKFSQEDAKLIGCIANDIQNRGGTVVQRYVADLSMATDIIISSRQEKSLCIQITSLSEEFYQEKFEKWEDTLQFWEIERGIFLSYNPSATNFVNQIGNIVLYNVDHLKTGIYLKFNL
ncbi:hypothetical protein NIES4103_58480 [Nostoc sp. NIES-4103]|nr:hypothetical protein NIES4103_58480 [Nostoc sp. NIES-4103]